GDLVAWTGFGHIGAGTLHYGGTAVPFQIEFQRDPADLGCLKRIVVDASEVIAQGYGHGKGGGHIFRGRKHVGQPHIWKSAHVDVAVHAIGGLFAVLVHSLQGVENGGHHHERRKARVVEHFVVELFRSAGPMNVEGYGNHLG